MATVPEQIVQVMQQLAAQQATLQNLMAQQHEAVGRMSAAAERETQLLRESVIRQTEAMLKDLESKMSANSTDSCAGYKRDQRESFITNAKANCNSGDCRQYPTVHFAVSRTTPLGGL